MKTDNNKGKSSVTQEIPVVLIKKGNNIRTRIDPLVLKELGESIQQKGIMAPLLVRKEAKPKGHYLLIAGYRRLEAAIQLKMKTVPVRVIEIQDDAIEDFQLAENIQREDLHPLDEARGFKALQQHGMDLKEIMKRSGKKTAYIEKILVLNQLPESMKKLFLAWKIGKNTATVMARMPHEKDRIELAGMLLEHIKESPDDEITESLVADWIRNNFMMRLVDVGFDIHSADLVPKAGSCDACPKRTGNQPGLFGEIEAEDVCTDLHCFKLKKLAHWNKLMETAREAGYGVMPREKSEDIFYSGRGIKSGAGYLDLDADIHLKATENRKDKTLRNLIGADVQPACIFLVLDLDDNPRYLVNQPVANHLLKEKGLLDKESRSQSTDSEKSERKKANEQKKLRQLALERIVMAVGATTEQHIERLPIAEILADFITHLGHDCGRYLLKLLTDTQSVDVGKGLGEYINGLATNKETQLAKSLGLAMQGIVVRDNLYRVPGNPSDVGSRTLAICNALRINVKDISENTQVAEALPESTASKSSTRKKKQSKKQKSR